MRVGRRPDTNPPPGAPSHTRPRPHKHTPPTPPQVSPTAKTNMTGGAANFLLKQEAAAGEKLAPEAMPRDKTVLQDVMLDIDAVYSKPTYTMAQVG